MESRGAIATCSSVTASPPSGELCRMGPFVGFVLPTGMEDTVCYERKSFYEIRKTVATEPKKQDAKRNEVVSNLMKDAQTAGQKANSDAPSSKEPVPAK